MGVRRSTSLIFEQLKPGRLVMWGSAAWAQTQLTPGVSTLAAPRSSIKPSRAGVDRSWTGSRRDLRQAGTRSSEVAFGRLGVAGGTALAATIPVTAALIILGAMGIMLTSTARLSGIEVFR